MNIHETALFARDSARVWEALFVAEHVNDPVVPSFTMPPVSVSQKFARLLRFFVSVMTFFVPERPRRFVSVELWIPTMLARLR